MWIIKFLLKRYRGVRFYSGSSQNIDRSFDPGSDRGVPLPAKLESDLDSYPGDSGGHHRDVHFLYPAWLYGEYFNTVRFCIGDWYCGG